MSKNVKISNPMKVITGVDTRWSYANAWEPKSINGGTPKYSVSLIIPKSDTKTIAKIKAAIEARVIAWYAGEIWRQKVFENGGDIYCASASQMFHVPVEKHGVNGHLRQKGKIAELALGYDGSVGALKAMGAIEMGLSKDELPPLVDAWRQTNPNIVKFWWDVDRAVMEAVKYKHTTSSYGLTFSCRSGILFITLPSGRNLAYVKPKVGTNIQTTLQTYVHDTEVMATRSVDLFEQAAGRKTS